MISRIVRQTYSIDTKNIKENVFCQFYIPTTANISINSKVNLRLREVSEKYSEYLAGKGADEEIGAYNDGLKSRDLTLLGLISDGEQDLVTGNNRRYIGKIVISENAGN